MEIARSDPREGGSFGSTSSLFSPFLIFFEGAGNVSRQLVPLLKQVYLERRFPSSKLEEKGRPPPSFSPLFLCFCFSSSPLSSRSSPLILLYILLLLPLQKLPRIEAISQRTTWRDRFLRSALRCFPTLCFLWSSPLHVNGTAVEETSSDAFEALYRSSSCLPSLSKQGQGLRRATRPRDFQLFLSSLRFV